MIICNKEAQTTFNKEILLFDINDYPQMIAHSLRREIEPLNGIIPIIQVKLLPENLKIKSEQKKNDAGIYFKNTVSFSIIEKSEPIREALMLASNSRLIVYLQATDRTAVIGDDMQSFELTYKEIFPTKSTDSEGYEITLNANTITPILGAGGVEETHPGCEWFLVEW